MYPRLPEKTSKIQPRTVRVVLDSLHILQPGQQTAAHRIQKRTRETSYCLSTET